jgi:adenylate cyclase
MSENELSHLLDILGELTEDLEEHAELVEERLEDIPNSHSMPDLEDMNIHEAKKFRLGVVFIDINDFSDYAWRNERKDVLFMLNMFIPQLMEAVREFDGVFEKNTGDGILAYFGAGDDSDEIAETVLEYFLTVQYLLDIEVNPILNDYDIEPITMSGGAAIGDVHISRIGVHSMNRRTAVSPTANVASILENKADTDQFFVSQGVAEYAGDSLLGGMLVEAGTLERYRWGSILTDWTDPAKYYEFPNPWEEILEDVS